MQGAVQSLSAFVVDRSGHKSVVAGYPWFLDWGRDSLIVCRGLTAAGLTGEAKEILKLFGGFEEKGTLPNMIQGRDAANRDTSDAPLWFFAAARDLVEKQGPEILDLSLGKRSLGQVLSSIVHWYMKGTPTGIVMDPETALVYSPLPFYLDGYKLSRCHSPAGVSR